MKFLNILKDIEKFILGESKPKNHWEKYRKPKDKNYYAI